MLKFFQAVACRICFGCNVQGLCQGGLSGVSIRALVPCSYVLVPWLYGWVALALLPQNDDGDALATALVTALRPHMLGLPAPVLIPAPRQGGPSRDPYLVPSHRRWSRPGWRCVGAWGVFARVVWPLHGRGVTPPSLRAPAPVLASRLVLADHAWAGGHCSALAARIYTD